MKYLYTVYDVKTAAYLDPFVSGSDAEATRLFMDCIAKVDHPFNRHPHDYSLVITGTWDPESAVITEMAGQICTGGEALALIQAERERSRQQELQLQEPSENA